jgi:hypothetical protein
MPHWAHIYALRNQLRASPRTTNLPIERDGSRSTLRSWPCCKITCIGWRAPTAEIRRSLEMSGARVKRPASYCGESCPLLRGEFCVYHIVALVADVSVPNTIAAMITTRRITPYTTSSRRSFTTSRMPWANYTQPAIPLRCSSTHDTSIYWSTSPPISTRNTLLIPSTFTSVNVCVSLSPPIGYRIYGNS